MRNYSITTLVDLFDFCDKLPDKPGGFRQVTVEAYIDSEHSHFEKAIDYLREEYKDSKLQHFKVWLKSSEDDTRSIGFRPYFRLSPLTAVKVFID